MKVTNLQNVVRKRLRAIDVYSGIGGWSLGLEMAGIDVVASYEWWNKANLTNLKNNRHVATEIDIRTLNLSELPKEIDIVVGSPPCTQFSFANRGGSGDIADGLKDIAKFLAIVDYLKPKFWAMENVPRVGSIIAEEMQSGGRLFHFAHLNPNIAVVDTSEWGVPQRRQRCIVGNFDFDLLRTYRPHTVAKTLGNVVRALSKATVKDPIYEIEVPRSNLTDHVVEESLSPEEERMNREMKTFHPIYNNMAFPDPLNRTARTVTATCTRVSRESIVIDAPEDKGSFRRLTVRERGCLQSFPVTYQFFGESHAQKLKMIGNAVPPLFTFYVAQAMQHVQPQNLIQPSYGIKVFRMPDDRPFTTRPDGVSSTYAASRRFRAAIPHLRFKSGMRFELANAFEEDQPRWRVNFYFGNSKNIGEIALDQTLLRTLKRKKAFAKHLIALGAALEPLQQLVCNTNARHLQNTWIHIESEGTHPYSLVDSLGQVTEEVIARLSKHEEAAAETVENLFVEIGNPAGTPKVLNNSTAVLAGLFVGASFNWMAKTAKFNKN